jgi:hypothetical protein
MPSPFPGMNPYLEQEDVWPDFHEHFLPHVAERLVPQVRPGYIVKIDEHVYIHELPAEERRFLGRGDVSVTDSGIPTDPRPATGALQAPASARLPAGIDVERHAFVEIRDRGSREVVTVVELLSPSNKRRGADREQYLAKRWHPVSSPVHLVEIDLLRGGPRLPLEGLPECEYYALVSRAEDRPRADLWPIRLRERLPIIPIPLRAPHPDARLDLQEILHHLYDAVGYEDHIYTGTPHPSLQPADAAWARQFIPPAQA